MHFRFQSRLLPSGMFAAALVLSTGCNTTKYVLQVDAITPPAPAGSAVVAAGEPHSYKVRSRNPLNPEDTLRYNEVAQYIKTALSGKGLYEAPASQDADLIVEIDYGMEKPRMKYETVMMPVMGPQPGVLEQGTLVSPNNSELNSHRPTPIVTSAPRKIIGMREEAELVVVYEKYLKVSARANKEAAEGRVPPEVWSVNVSAVDGSNELRKYMPILASATADFIGVNTHEEKEVAVNEHDDSVTFIKKGM